MIVFLLILVNVILLVLQIVYLRKSINSKSNRKWFKLFLLEVISIVIASTLCYYLNSLPGEGPFAYLFEAAVCLIFIFIFFLMVVISAIIKIVEITKKSTKASRVILLILFLILLAIIVCNFFTIIK